MVTLTPAQHVEIRDQRLEGGLRVSHGLLYHLDPRRPDGGDTGRAAVFHGAGFCQAFAQTRRFWGKPGGATIANGAITAGGAGRERLRYSSLIEKNIGDVCTIGQHGFCLPNIIG